MEVGIMAKENENFKEKCIDYFADEFVPLLEKPMQLIAEGDTLNECDEVFGLKVNLANELLKSFGDCFDDDIHTVLVALMFRAKRGLIVEGLNPSIENVTKVLFSSILDHDFMREAYNLINTECQDDLHVEQVQMFSGENAENIARQIEQNNIEPDISIKACGGK